HPEPSGTRRLFRGCLHLRTGGSRRRSRGTRTRRLRHGPHYPRGRGGASATDARSTYRNVLTPDLGSTSKLLALLLDGDGSAMVAGRSRPLVDADPWITKDRGSRCVQDATRRFPRPHRSLAR